MNKKVGAIILLLIISSVWLYLLDHTILEFKNDHLSTSRIISEIIINLYVIVNIIYLLYYVFMKKNK